VCWGILPLAHLLFVDDCYPFCKVKESDENFSRSTLKTYEEVFG